jgi:hypothetical protein
VFRYEAIAIDPGEYHRRDHGIQVFRRQPATR